MKLYQAFLWMMIVSLALAAALGVWALLTPRFGSLQEQVLITSLLVAALSLPAFGCAIVLHRKRDRLIMWLGIATAAAALAIWLTTVWTRWSIWHPPDAFYQSGASLTAIALWAAHFGLIRLTKLTRAWSRHVRTATIGLGALLACTFLFAVWGEVHNDRFLRFIGIVSILAVCGTIVTPILALIDLITARGSRESLPSSLRIELTCPRCGSAQRITAGAGRCASCGLRIAVDVEEPRCSCGYLLHKLHGENCPECGRDIPEAERWHVARHGPAHDLHP